MVDEDQRDRFAGHRHAVAELAHQGLGGMRQRLEARQAEEAAGPLDGVDQAENVVENLRVVGFLLEANQLDVDGIEAFVRLGEEFPEQVVHGNKPSWPGTTAAAAFREQAQCVVKGFNFGCCTRPTAQFRPRSNESELGNPGCDRKASGSLSGGYQPQAFAGAAD